MDEHYLSSQFRTVRLRRGTVEVEFLPSQLTCEAISRVFKVSTDSVWLREEVGSRALFPSPNGKFEVEDSLIGYTFSVEGSPQTQQHGPISHNTVRNVLGMQTANTSSPNAVALSITPSTSSPGFHSVVAKNTKSTSVTVKVTKARMSYSPSGKPVFEKEGQIFVEISEATANVHYILTVVQREWGEESVLVTNDGLEIPDSSGTKGLKFWKVPSRKVYAVREEDLCRGGPSCSASKQRKVMANLDDAVEPIHCKLEEIGSTLCDMKGQIQDILSISSDANVPMGLKLALRDAFKCRICLASPITPPIIIGKCCKALIGCQRCVDAWYSGAEGLTKQCPNCRAERGYAETARLIGLDDLMESIGPLFATTDDSSAQ